MRSFGRPIAVVGVLVFAILGATVRFAAADAVVLTLSATNGADGVTVSVGAPGCQPTPPGAFDIVVQARDATTGEVGEGAVALGGFTALGEGSVVIPSGTPVNSFLLTVTCNGGALTGSQAFVIDVPAPRSTSSPSFTG